MTVALAIWKRASFGPIFTANDLKETVKKYFIVKHKQTSVKLSEIRLGNLSVSWQKQEKFVVTCNNRVTSNKTNLVPQVIKELLNFQYVCCLDLVQLKYSPLYKIVRVSKSYPPSEAGKFTGSFSHM